MSTEHDMYRIEIAGLTRDLPLIKVATDVRIAFIDSLHDTEFIRTTALALAKKLKPFAPTVLVSPETKGIIFVYCLAEALNCRYVILRKAHKAYMPTVVSVPTNSIGSGMQQNLFLDTQHIDLLVNGTVALIDDVISTGSTLAAMEKLMAIVGARVVVRGAIFTEGEAKDRSDIVALGHLPIFDGGR